MSSHIEHAEGSLFDASVQRVSPVSFYIHGETNSPLLRRVTQRLQTALIQAGCQHRPERAEQARLILNVTSVDKPTPVRRQSRAAFVTSIIEGPAEADPLRACYPLLIRTLANILLYVVPKTDSHCFTLHGITPERGHFQLEYHPDRDGDFYDQLVERLMPIATSHLIIENEFYPDLPEHLWVGDEHTQAICEAGKRLDRLGLLPAPFNLSDLLTPSDLRHLQRLYKIGGLSYGNMSERLDGQRFWMSASGVDKSNMREVGRDVLLVKGFSPERQSIMLSVPPHVKPRRVSVDAIEHWMIYSEHPSVGAILHVHAWMDGVPSTEVSYPCGTIELARAVADLIRQADDPAQCVVGLKNHGLTITGPSLREILDRVEGRLLKEIPMT